MDERAGRIAFVAEDFDLEDAFRLSGLFSAHWESLDDQQHGRGPEAVPVGEAIAWAREHACFVSVRLGGSDTHYTAGERDLAELDDEPGEPDPPWPAEGMVIRPRPLDSPLDGSVQEVDWLIEANTVELPSLDAADLSKLKLALNEDGRLRDIELDHVDEPESSSGPSNEPTEAPHLRLRCTFRARGAERAVIETDEAFDDALATVFPADEAWVASAHCIGPVSKGPRDR